MPANVHANVHAYLKRAVPTVLPALLVVLVPAPGAAADYLIGEGDKLVISVPAVLVDSGGRYTQMM